MLVTEKFSKSHLSAAVFVSRAYKALDQINQRDFFLRPKECKDVIEEIIPIAAFLKHFEIPGRSVKCKYFGKNHCYEAEILVSGYFVDMEYSEGKYYLEVTTAVPESAHLARMELALTGFTFGDGNIGFVGSKQKGTSKIVSHPAAEDHDALVNKTSELIKERLSDKANGNYPKPCILVINSELERPLTLHEWLTVVNNISESVNREKFALTFIMDAFRNTVIPV